MMPKRIHNASQPPSICFCHRYDFFCTRCDCLRKYSIRINYRQDHPYRTTPERFRTEICMFRRFISHPEFRSVNRKPRHHRAARIFDVKNLRRPERLLIKFHRSRPIPH